MRPDAVWAVLGLMLIALVVAGIGLPLGKDAPLGSSIEVGRDSAQSAIGAGAGSIAGLHRPSAKESSGASRDGDRPDRHDQGASRPPAETESTTAPAELALADPTASVPGTEVTSIQAPAVGAPAPRDDSQGGSTGGDPPNTTGGAAGAAAVREDLVDEMLDVP